MRSLASYRGEPTWWDNHLIITGFVRVILVLIGLAPLIGGYVWLIVSFNHAYYTGTIWNMPPVWQLGLAFGASLVWAVFWINAAVALNV
ncbi:MAG TPA: hypothetical protein VLE72_00050 [Candidatus Saccharimonadales bacterium]|nr:hypothetical protein [Candidatus Saccharimonadales bacterium]